MGITRTYTEEELSQAIELARWDEVNFINIQI